VLLLLFVVCCLLFVVCCLLFDVCCLLLLLMLVVVVVVAAAAAVVVVAAAAAVVVVVVVVVVVAVVVVLYLGPLWVIVDGCENEGHAQCRAGIQTDGVIFERRKLSRHGRDRKHLLSLLRPLNHTACDRDSS
jgi:hypothetical protein